MILVQKHAIECDHTHFIWDLIAYPYRDTDTGSANLHW